MRNTKQKELILNIINNSYDHLNALEVYLIAKEDMPNISLGTVYRNLNLLVSDEQIIRIKTKERDRFDAKRENHNHFICIKCNKIIDIKNDYELSSNYINGNKVIDYQIKYIGICRECLEEEKNGIKG